MLPDAITCKNLSVTEGWKEYAVGPKPSSASGRTPATGPAADEGVRPTIAAFGSLGAARRSAVRMAPSAPFDAADPLAGAHPRQTSIAPTQIRPNMIARPLIAITAPRAWRGCDSHIGKTLVSSPAQT